MNESALKEALRLDWIAVEEENKVGCKNTKPPNQAIKPVTNLVRNSFSNIVLILLPYYGHTSMHAVQSGKAKVSGLFCPY